MSQYFNTPYGIDYQPPRSPSPARNIDYHISQKHSYSPENNKNNVYLKASTSMKQMPEA